MRSVHIAPALLVAALVACRGDMAEERSMYKVESVGAGGGGAGGRSASRVVAPAAMRMRTELASEAVNNSLIPIQPSAMQSMWAGMKLIRTAEVTLEVANVDSAVASMDSIAAGSNAFVANTRITHAGGRGRSAQLVVRVASDRFSEALAALRTLGKVTHEAVSTEDITKEYADLAVRMGIKQDAVTRLRSLLSNRTGKLSDVLEVERELSRAVTEFEQMKGEQRYYDQRIAISTISVQVAEPGTFAKPGFLSTVGGALRASTDVFTTSLTRLIYIVTFLLPWVAFIAVVWLLTRRRLRWRIGWLPPA